LPQQVNAHNSALSNQTVDSFVLFKFRHCRLC